MNYSRFKVHSTPNVFSKGSIFIRILIYGLNFSPEPIGVGKYTGEMSSALAAAGHEVRVVTSLPYYPSWKIDGKYKWWRYVREVSGQISVIRCPLWVPLYPNAWRRIIHLLSFAITSMPVILSQAFWKPDLVWMAAPTMACAPAALIAAALANAKTWIHVQDFEIDIAFGMGMLNGGRIRSLALSWERWTIKRFTRVSTISKTMVERMVEKGVDAKRVILIRNWTDIYRIKPYSGISPYRLSLKIPSDAVVALYSGSMGIKQGIDWLAEVAKILSAESGLYFVFCGDGPLKEIAMAECSQLPNVKFMPLQPTERLNDLLGCADIHLLPQRPDASAMVMPSKLTGMLASGRPIVAMAEINSELAEIVSLCGRVVAPGDLDGFCKAITELKSCEVLRYKYGESARRFAEDNLSLHGILDSMEEHIKSVVSES